MVAVVTTTAASSPLVDVPPLAGFTVGVTAARRAEELGTMLERRGAVVLHGPALRIVPVADDTDLLAATRELIADPPDITVATTGIGYRGWAEDSDGGDQASTSPDARIAPRALGPRASRVPEPSAARRSSPRPQPSAASTQPR